GQIEGWVGGQQRLQARVGVAEKRHALDLLLLAKAGRRSQSAGQRYIGLFKDIEAAGGARLKADSRAGRKIREAARAQLLSWLDHDLAFQHVDHPLAPW